MTVFSWSYKYKRYSVDVAIPQGLYDAYQTVGNGVREANFFERFGFFITTMDKSVSALCSKLKVVCAEKGFSREETAQFLLNFVHYNIRYKDDYKTSGFRNFGRFPVETLFLRYGDCEDSTALALTLLNSFLFDTMLVNPPAHYAVLVKGDFSGKNVDGYFYSETRGGIGVGKVGFGIDFASANYTKLDDTQQYRVDCACVAVVSDVECCGLFAYNLRKAAQFFVNLFTVRLFRKSEVKK